MCVRVREVRVELAVETQKLPLGFSIYFSLILYTWPFPLYAYFCRREVKQCGFVVGVPGLE